HRMKLQQTHCLFNGTLELRIVSRDDIFGPILDIDIRRNAFVLDRPFAIMTEEAAAGCDRRSAVDKNRRVGRVHEATPGSFADRRAELSIMEHVRHEIAAGAGHLVNDHYLWSPDAGGGTREWITIAGDVVEITVKVALQDIDDVISR